MYQSYSGFKLYNTCTGKLCDVTGMTAIYIVNLKLPAFISIHIYLFPLCDVINNSYLSLCRHGEILLCNPATHFYFSISILDFVVLFDQWRSQYGCPPPHLDSKKFAKNLEKSGEIWKKRGKSGKNREKRGKIGKKRQKLGRFFHFAPPDR